jgi:hypothetical protein
MYQAPQGDLHVAPGEAKTFGEKKAQERSLVCLVLGAVPVLCLLLDADVRWMSQNNRAKYLSASRSYFYNRLLPLDRTNVFLSQMTVSQ